MARLQNVFDASQIAPDQSSFSGLPLGKHPVIIFASDIKGNKAGTGGYLYFEVEIIDGPNKGEKGNFIINLYAEKESNARRAAGQASALSHVTGVFKWDDTAQLHGKPFVVEVGNQKLTDEQQSRAAAGETVTPFTEVKKILDMQCNEPGKPPAQQNTQQTSNQNTQQQAGNQGGGASTGAGWNNGGQAAGQGAATNSSGAQWNQGGAAQETTQQAPAAGGWQAPNQGGATGGAAAGGTKMPWGQ